jgi:hypothetical protein
VFDRSDWRNMSLSARLDDLDFSMFNGSDKLGRHIYYL